MAWTPASDPAATRPLQPNQIPGCRLRTGRIATARPPARLAPSRLGTATRLETTTSRSNLPSGGAKHLANILIRIHTYRSRLRRKKSALSRRPKRQLKAAGPSIQLKRSEPVRVSVALAPKHVGGKEPPCKCPQSCKESR